MSTSGTENANGTKAGSDHVLADGAPESFDLDKVSDVFARVAHELKTPLAVSKGFAITLRDSLEQLDPEMIKRCCDAIVRGITNAETLVQSLAQTRSVDAGDLHLDLVEIEAGDFVAEVVRDLSLLTTPHPVSISILGDGRLMCDRSKIRQVLTNLISNAAKFSAPTAPISLEVCLEDGWLDVDVIDKGSGISSENLTKLFQKYERLGSDVKGTGLGLYISRGIALAHGGDLSATSDGRSGCRFKLRIPVDPEKVWAEKAARPHASTAGAES